MKMFRQGDVLLIKIAEAIPAGATCIGRGARIVLAYGEATGHTHAVAGGDAGLYELRDERFLDVRTACALVHEEHGAIDLDPGVYRVMGQREYAPGDIRRVQD